MELQSESLRSNKGFLKEILDNSGFYNQVSNLREKYPYLREGKWLFKENKVPDKKKKQEIIEKLLDISGYQYKFSKRDRLFSFKKYFNEYLMYCHIEIDETSIGGHFGIYIHSLEFENYLFGGQLDSLLKDFYNIEIETYRYCAVTEDDVREITFSILQIFDDIFDELKSRLSL